MATHVKVLAVLSVVLGVLSVVGGLFMSVLFGVLASFVGADPDPDAGVASTILGLTGAALSIYLFISGAVNLICGWGLLKRRRWSRILGIVLAAIMLIAFPIGTAIGVYALWVLFHKETEALFAAAT